MAVLDEEKGWGGEVWVEGGTVERVKKKAPSDASRPFKHTTACGENLAEGSKRDRTNGCNGRCSILYGADCPPPILDNPCCYQDVHQLLWETLLPAICLAEQ